MMFLKTFTQLKKDSRQDPRGLAQYRIAVLGDCSTQHLSISIKGVAYEQGIGLSVLDADYNQIDAQLLNPGSEVYKFSPQSILIYMCTEKLYESFCNTPLEYRTHFAETMFGEIESYWNLIGSHVKANILQFLFLNYDDMVFGSCASRFECSFFFQVIKLNSMMLEKGATAYRNIFLIDLNSIQNEVGRSVFYDPKLYYIGKIPVSLEALPYVAQRVTSVISAMMGRIKKCVVLDLDNTLWGGAIGDDGMEGIQIGELGLGHAYQDFQRWLRELRLRGVLLAVCSKNNEETAKEPFLKHPEMILQLDDISLFVANWQDKVTNIRYIQRILNIGMDSMVFIDDNPFERNLVRDTIPEITVPELPDDSSLYLSYLQGLDLFGTASYSDADKERTRQYQEEVGRIEQRQKFASLDDYLKSLGMVANVRPFDSFSYPRIAQLTQRSNQFNLRTIRYTDEDIARIARDQKYLTLEFFLDDKYGSNGLVSAIIMEKRESGLFIDTWLMSCRVLKRGMEEFIINKVIDVAEANGFKAVFGEYIRTPKNSMVEKIYSTLGFKEVSENRFEVIVGQFRKNKTYIQEKGE